MTTPTEPMVQAAGLLIPESLMPRINAACKGLYPDVTAGLDGDPAIRAVLKYFISSLVATWESQQAGVGVEDAVSAVREDYRQRVTRASQQAFTDTSVITDAPPPAVP